MTELGFCSCGGMLTLVGSDVRCAECDRFIMSWSEYQQRVADHAFKELKKDFGQ